MTNLFVLAAALAMAAAGASEDGGRGGGMGGMPRPRGPGDMPGPGGRPPAFAPDSPELRNAADRMRTDVRLKDDDRRGGANGTAGVFADFNGASDGFRLYMNNTAGGRPGRRAWQVRYLKVAEVDGSGAEIPGRARPLALASVTKSAGVEVDDATNATLRYVRLSYRMPLQPSVVINVTHALYDRDVNITMPCAACDADVTGATVPPTVTAKAGALKIIIEAAGWTFSPTAAGLKVDIKVGDGGGREDLRPDTLPPPPPERASLGDVRAALGRVSDDIKQRMMERAHNATMRHLPPVLRMPGDDGDGTAAVLQFETFAIVDGDASNPALVTTVQAGNVVSITLPLFTSSLWYDPTITMESTGPSSGTAAQAVGASTLAAAMALGIALVMGRVAGDE